MKGNVRNILIYVVGIVALIVAGASIVVAGIDIIKQFDGIENLLSITNTSLYSNIIELVFAGMELFVGVDLIKKWRNNEHFEVQKSILQLLSAIVYASMLQVFVFSIFNAIIENTASAINISTIYVILSILYTTFVSSIGIQIKKRQLMNILTTMLVVSLLALGLGVYESIIALVEEPSFIDVAIMFGNILLVVLVLLFECFSIVYFKKRPLVLDEIVRENEDVDVIKQTDDYEVVKIYTTRVQEGAVNVVNTVVYMLACAFFIVGIIFFAIEKNVFTLFVGSVGGFIENISHAIHKGSISIIMDITCMLMLLIIYPLILISFIDGVLRRKANQKINITSFTNVGVAILTFSSFSIILKFLMNFSSILTLDFSNYSIMELVIIVINVGYTFISKIFSNVQKNINSSINSGDSYTSHSKGIAKLALVIGLYSCLCYAVLFVQTYLDLKTISLVYVFLILATVLFIIGTAIESKHPYSEFSIVKRRIIHHLNETQQDKNVV